MKIATLERLIANREGLKSEVSIGNIREIVGIISDVLAKEDGEIGHADTYSSLVEKGKNRMKPLVKKKVSKKK
jgi:hypothetical protein